MKDFRCANCNKLLAKIDGKGRVDIVCPKCRSMNVISEVFNMEGVDFTSSLPNAKVTHKNISYIQVAIDKTE